MEENKEYYAFISYKSEDVEWAIWLQHELEHYHLPASFNGRTDIRQELRPVFRDIDELSAGNLPEQIKRALENSQNLIVVCSPQAAASQWVNQEVETFISLGRTDRIFPFIVDGNSPKEFFPPALLALPENEERLGGDAAKQGRDIAFVKIVSGMLGLGFDSLWNRYEREKSKMEREERDRRDRLLGMQSQLVTRLVYPMIAKGDSLHARRVLLEVLPRNLEQPDRPYLPEVGTSMLVAFQNNDAILAEDDAEFFDVTYSPDGKYIGASSSGVLFIWDADNGKLVRSIYCRGGDMIVHIVSLAFSPDSRYVAAATNTNQKIYVWNVETGECLKTMAVNANRVFSVSFSPDGRRLLSTSADKTLGIWDVLTGERIGRIAGRFGMVRSAKYSHNGKYIASGCGFLVRLMDVDSGKSLNVFWGHTGTVLSVAFNADDSMLASASRDKTIRLWDVSSGRFVRKLKGHKRIVTSVAFSPDGRFVVSASFDQTIRIWEVATGKCVQVYEGQGLHINSVAYSPDGKNLASASGFGSVRVWDARFHKEQPTEECEVHSVCYYPDGRLVADAKGTFFGNYVTLNWEDVVDIELSDGYTHNLYFPVLNAERRNNDMVVGQEVVKYQDVVKVRYCISLQTMIAETKKRFENNPLTPEERKHYYME